MIFSKLCIPKYVVNRNSSINEFIIIKNFMIPLISIEEGVIKLIEIAPLHIFRIRLP